jgi:two-component system sensor histidine kinase KdpD
MKRPAISISMQTISQCLVAVLAVLALTGAMLLIGRAALGEAVIALLYLTPIGWSTARWGRIAGICASVSAALAFDFCFIPPFYTFTVGSLEGWLVLAIFLAVAVLIVGRIQSGLSQAQAREREAVLLYELIAALAGKTTADGVARTLANHLQQNFLAAQVQVIVEANAGAPSLVVSAPANHAPAEMPSARPDRLLPMAATGHLAGEIRLWGGQITLPPADSRLLQSYAVQGALALERARLAQSAMIKTA